MIKQFNIKQKKTITTFTVNHKLILLEMTLVVALFQMVVSKKLSESNFNVADKLVSFLFSPHGNRQNRLFVIAKTAK